MSVRLRGYYEDRTEKICKIRFPDIGSIFNQVPMTGNFISLFENTSL